MKTKEIINRGDCYMVGNGIEINVWKEPWIPYLCLCDKSCIKLLYLMP